MLNLIIQLWVKYALMLKNGSLLIISFGKHKISLYAKCMQVVFLDKEQLCAISIFLKSKLLFNKKQEYLYPEFFFLNDKHFL